MNPRLVTAAAALLAGPLWAGPAPQATIELLEQARVGEGPVALGQVARLTSNDLDLMRALVALPIGRSPPAGHSAAVDREELDTWVRRRLRIADDRLQWVGAQSSHVMARSRAVTGEEIAETASQMLRQWLATSSDRSEVQLQLLPRDIEAPESGVRLEARSLANAQLRKRMVVWVDVWAADRFVRTVPVSFNVAAWREVATAAGSLEAGAPLASQTLVSRQVDMAAQVGSPMPAPPVSDAPLRARRALRAGEVVGVRDLEQVPAVARGQWASLRSGSGAVVLEARVEVLQDGRPGEMVRVRQPGAMAGVVAKVVGPGQLEVVR